jgi:hypothetical protein
VREIASCVPCVPIHFLLSHRIHPTQATCGQRHLPALASLLSSSIVIIVDGTLPMLVLHSRNRQVSPVSTLLLVSLTRHRLTQASCVRTQGQLQKHEDSAPEALEFERLKEHFEPLLRAATSSTTHSAHIPHSHSNPITAAASNALARDIPGVARYNPLTRSHRRDKTAPKDEMPEYRSRLDVASVGTVGAGGEADVDFLRHLETVDEVASLDQRWFSSWAAPLQMR